jgi:hypothetical protein
MRPAAAAASLLALCLAACAEKIPPAPLGPGVAIPETRSAPTLGVLPLADGRPAIQHSGKKPSLLVFLVWNSRTGDYVTGENAFQGSVTEQVTALVSGAMSGGRFGEARRMDVAAPAELAGESGGDQVPGDQSGADRACRASGLRFVATGELKDLYGTLHEKSYLWILPTPWAGAAGWNRKRSDPLGVARLVLRVRDCASGALVFDRDLRSENRYVHATLSEAAGLALTDVLQKLRNEMLPNSAAPYVPAPAEYRRDLPAPPAP